MSCLRTIAFPQSPNSLPQDLKNYLINTKNSSNATEQQQCMGLTIDGNNNFSYISNDIWLPTWASGVCFNFLDDVPLTIQQEMMYYINGRYYNLQAFVTNKYLVPPAQNNIMNVCSNYPGSCTSAESYMCSTCQANQISSQYQLLRFCGCFAPASQVEQNNISPQCQSLCSNNIAIKLADQFGNQLECNQSVCVIDNLSIQSSNTIFNQSSISEVCTGCQSSGGCKCFIDSSIPDLSSVLGVEGDNNLFKLYCPDSECFTVNGNVTTQVSCAEFNKTLSTPLKIILPAWFLWILLLVFVIGMFVILSLYLWGQSFRINYFKIWSPTEKSPFSSSRSYTSP